MQDQVKETAWFQHTKQLKGVCLIWVIQGFHSSLCVNPDVTDGYLTDTTPGFCFCVFVFVWKCLYKPGKLVVFQTTKHWMHLGKDMFETMTTDCSSSYFLFQRLFLLFSYCSFFHRQSKFTSVHLFLCTRVSSEVGYVLCFHMGDLTVTFFAFCAQ